MEILDTDPLPGSLGILTILLEIHKAIEFHAPTMSWSAWILIVAIALVCLMLSAFVSGSEISYFGLSPQEIDDIHENAEENANPRYRLVNKLVSRPEQLLATILIANNLVNITMVVLLAFAINAVVAFNSEVVAFLLQTVLLTFLLLLFGEILPKLVARNFSLKWALNTAPALNIIYTLLSPFAKTMARSTTLVNKIVSKKSESLSTDELERALEISDVKEGKDKEMLEGILSFGEKDVSDIMISRVDVTGIESHATLSEVVKVVVESGYSRIPVYDRSQDAIIGVLYSKDLLPHIGKKDDSFEWQKLLRKPYFVPESRMIDDLLEDFRKKHIHIAIVIDEYGGTMGIVTLEDIIEEIVGEIDDEYDEDSRLYKKIGPDTYVFEGKIPLVDFFRVIDIDEEDFGDTGEAETLAGLILDIKGDFPQEKEALKFGPCNFLVLDLERHRIKTVRVHVNR